ncbi:hypothetical protein D1B31_14860 [Neobacillus notoginsengisoli]|uniref:Uncharacterized protein n=1 Tax=Neobacillus notoginsengisoli TaxID=1578198 RepID=A0A417YRY4_9BACI|nr:hypothetical protein [Neobacillus notoginsengisoli]RHW38058.1 hypothetical protein D1B31_14860 [Neobacillus notoginsengisoli]
MRFLTGFLCLALAFPAVASANETIESHSNGQEGSNHCAHGSCGFPKVARELKENEIISWAEKYTPEKAEEWKAVFAERKVLKERWLSPEMKDKRESWKKEKAKRIGEIQELKKQFEEGKLTREDYLKQAYEKIKQSKPKLMKGYGSYFKLKEAVEQNDAGKAAALLNELLEFQKQHNETLKARLEK